MVRKQPQPREHVAAAPATQDSGTIKAAVRHRYGGYAKQHLAHADTEIAFVEVLAAGPDRAACCSAPASGDEMSSCGVEGGVTQKAIRAPYAAIETAWLPASVAEASLGCGNPAAIAELQPGETVLDLGSGGGIDCFLAAKHVGSTGHVIGVDMTDEMLELARANARKVGARNVEFRKGEIEALPLEDASVDVILSNCVINLSTNKARTLREAYRVLKPGGRFRVSDIVLTRQLPFNEEQYLASWSECIAGALTQDEFAAKLEAAGFEHIQLTLEGEHQEGVHSALIEAAKPYRASPSAATESGSEEDARRSARLSTDLT